MKKMKITLVVKSTTELNISYSQTYTKIGTESEHQQKKRKCPIGFIDFFSLSSLFCIKMKFTNFGWNCFGGFLLIRFSFFRLQFKHVVCLNINLEWIDSFFGFHLVQLTRWKFSSISEHVPCSFDFSSTEINFALVLVIHFFRLVERKYSMSLNDVNFPPNKHWNMFANRRPVLSPFLTFTHTLTHTYAKTIILHSSKIWKLIDL